MGNEDLYAATLLTFLDGGGECGALIRAFDWAATELGPAEGWQQSLKTAVSLMLGSAQPVYVAWGGDCLSMYNDGYLPIVGTKHPGIGLPFRELWAEIWDEFKPIVAETLAGKSQYFVDMPIPLAGRPDTPVGYFTFSYTALRDEFGEIRGFYCSATETTDRVRAEAERRAGEQRLRAVLDTMDESLAILDRDYRIVDMNAEAMRMEHRPREEIIGKTHWEAHPEAVPALGKLYEEAMTKRIPVSVEYRYRWPDGRMSWLAMRASPIEEGGIAIFYRDITERVEREAALAANEAKYHALFEAIDAGFCLLDLIFDETGEAVDYRFLEVNPAFAELTGMSDAVGRRVREYFPDDTQWFDMFSEVVRTGRPVRIEGLSQRMSRWWDLHAFRAGSAGDARIALLFTDISERKRAEEHQRLLMDELSHRSKNLLAIVQSVALQSFRGEGSLDDMRAAFEGRLGALSAAHSILTREKWEHAPLREIIADTIAAVCSADDRVHIAGPDLEIAPKTGVSLAMAVHELATNAVKYGSLANSSGTIDVRWSVDDDRLVLLWREAGGPAVTPPPRRGFGTRMIERGLAAELNGTATIDFDPAGIVCTVRAPLPRVGA